MTETSQLISSELQSEKELLDTLLNTNNDEFNEYFKKNIIDNVNLSQDLKTDWLRLFSRNYKLMNLSRNDINQIMEFYKILELKTIEELRILEPEVGFYLSVIRLNLSLDLNRVLIVKPKPSKNNIILFISRIFKKGG